MSEFITIPLANPIRLYDIDEGMSHAQYTPDFETNRCYFQKFNYDDNLRVQILLSKTHWDSIGLYLLDSELNEVELNPGGFYGDYGTEYDLWNCYSETILNQVEGIYFIEVRVVVVVDPESVTLTTQDRVLRSEPIHIAEAHEKTVLIKYSNDSNKFNLKFITDFVSPPQLYFYLRVEGGILSDGFKPGSKDEVYIDQVRSVVLLDSEPFIIYTFSFGSATGMPNWLADKINRVLSCNLVTINNKQFSKNDGAKLEPSRSENYSLAGWKIDLVSNTDDDFIPDDAGSALSGYCGLLSGGGSGETHERLHKMDNPLDHEAVASEDYGKIPRANYSDGKWALTAPVVIPFTATATPTISAYQATYAHVYGEYPVVECWLVDGTTRTLLMQPPIISLSAGLIDSIMFDLGFENTGFIIIR